MHTAHTHTQPAPTPIPTSAPSDKGDEVAELGVAITGTGEGCGGVCVDVGGGLD